ncbi:hypothetical protein TNCV_4488281 [Trichonephila clavipes]|nr:hypothetical protein TNCV_4488281 [Trichonephila clavipes]
MRTSCWSLVMTCLRLAQSETEVVGFEVFSDLEDIEDRDLYEYPDFTDVESISDSESLIANHLEAILLTIKALKMAAKVFTSSLCLMIKKNQEAQTDTSELYGVSR